MCIKLQYMAASKQACTLQTQFRNAVPLVWGLLRLAPITWGNGECKWESMVSYLLHRSSLSRGGSCSKQVLQFFITEKISLKVTCQSAHTSSCYEWAPSIWAGLYFYICSAYNICVQYTLVATMILSMVYRLPCTNSEFVSCHREDKICKLVFL